MTATATLPTKEAEHAERTRPGAYYRPSVDILELPDELWLQADMPGVKGDEIDIRFEDGELKIHGPVAPRQQEAAGLLAAEYGIGDFYRTFRVSEQIDPARIAAEYSQGVLTVKLPKVEAAKPRKVEVRVNA